MERMKKLTLPEWFKLKTGETWTTYCKKVRNGDYSNPVLPSDIRMIWNAALKYGKKK